MRTCNVGNLDAHKQHLTFTLFQTPAVPCIERHKRSRQSRQCSETQIVIREQMNGSVLTYHFQAVRGWSKKPLGQGLGKPWSWTGAKATQRLGKDCTFKKGSRLSPGNSDSVKSTGGFWCPIPPTRGKYKKIIFAVIEEYNLPLLGDCN